MCIFIIEMKDLKNNKNTNGKGHGDKCLDKDSRLDRYSRTSYFLKKDQQAKDFLKKHPVPSNYLK